MKTEIRNRAIKYFIEQKDEEIGGPIKKFLTVIGVSIVFVFGPWLIGSFTSWLFPILIKCEDISHALFNSCSAEINILKWATGLMTLSVITAIILILNWLNENWKLAVSRAEKDFHRRKKK